jgi:D-threo-aldose 1-dehydrogenase
MDNLPTRRVGQSLLKLPILGFGGAPLGELFDLIPENQSRQTLQSAWSAGIRFYDTAPWYGHGLSEHRIGGLLRQQNREDFICSTKVGRVYSRFMGKAKDFYGPPWVGGLPFTLKFDYTYDGILRSYEDSLLRLGLNRVDVLIIHDIDLNYHRTESHINQRFRELESGWKALDELKRSGEIQAFGAGINKESLIPRFLEECPLDFFLVAHPYTLLDQGVLDTIFPKCGRLGVGVVVGAPYASGILATGAVQGAKYRYSEATPDMMTKVQLIERICKDHQIPLKAAALQFPLGHPLVASVIPGAFRPEQVMENRKLFEHPIPASFWDACKTANLIRMDAPVPSNDF